MTTALEKKAGAPAATSLGELQGLASGLCLDAGILVEASEEQGWHYDHDRRAIVVPGADIRSKGAVYCAGVLAHEVGHFFISRYHEMSHGIAFPSAAILNHLLNATEDPRVNRWIKARYPGTRPWFETLRDDFREPPRDLPDILTFGIECHAEEMLDWQPRRQGLLPAKVECALTETRESRIAMSESLPSRVPGSVFLHSRLAAQVDEVFRAMPAPHAALADAGELEVLMHQGRSLMLFKEGVAPCLAPLLESDLLRLGWHLLRRGLLHRVRRLAAPGKLVASAARSLMPEVQRAMAEVKMPPTTWEPAPREREGLMRLLEAFINGSFPQTMRSPQGACTRPGSGPRGRALGSAAKAAPAPKSTAKPPEACPDVKACRLAVDGADHLERLVREGLNPRRHRRHHGSFPSGARLSMREVLRYEAQPERYRKLWQRPVRPTQPDAAFGLLVDLSGSMAGDKIVAAVKGTLLLAQTLARLKVPCLIHGFQDRLIPFTGWEDGFDEGIRDRIGSMTLEVGNRRPGGNNKSGNNDDGPCLEEFATLVSAHPARQKFLVVVSDGEPAGARSTPADLVKAVANVAKHGDIQLIGLGLGQGTAHVANYYPMAIINVSEREFPAKIGSLILRACGVA